MPHTQPTKRPRVDDGAATTPSETVRLRDETPGASLQAGLTQLWRDGEGCDITIRVPAGLEDCTAAAGASVATTEIKAHRVVLAAVSAPFHRMIFGDMASVDENNVLTLGGIDPAALRSVVKYAYSGTLEFTQFTVWEVLGACKYLELEVATKLCTKFLCEQLTPANALGVVKAAANLQCAALESAALAFVKKHIGSVSELQINELMGEKPVETIDLSGKGLTAKSAIFIASCIQENGVLKKLKCANSPHVLAFVSAPIDTTSFLGSLSGNELCGINFFTGNGTYTTEGITKLCEGLKGSAVTSLKCAAAPECSLPCQRPLTRLLSHHPHPTPCLAVSTATELEMRVPLRSLPS